MSEVTFKSLQRSDDVAYRIHGDSMALYQYRPNGNTHLADWCGEFQIFGDSRVLETGQWVCTQHSHEYAVQRENMADFLASLATVMLADPKAREIAACYWPRPINAELIQFLSKLKYDPAVFHQYFSKETMKVSKKSEKQHDKRWHEIPRWLSNDDPLSVKVFALANIDQEWQDDYLTRYAKLSQIRTALSDWQFEIAKYLEIPDKPRILHQAWDAADQCIKGHVLMHNAENQLDCYRHNAGLKDQTTESDAA